MGEFIDTLVMDVLENPLDYLLAALLGLAGGGVTAYLLWRRGSERWKITRGELVAGALIVCFLQVPLVNVASIELAKSNAEGGFQELWGGSLVDGYPRRVPCTEDGFCTPTYNCHPYWVKVVDHYKTVYDGYDSKTKTRKSHQEPVYRDEQRVHQCPFIKFLTDWVLVDSFGVEQDVESHVLPQQLESFEGDAIPSSLVARGPPAFWTQAMDAAKANNPLPANKTNSYVNYLLAAQSDQLENFSDKVDYYRARGLLVDHTKNVHSPINSRRVAEEMMFVQKTPPNEADWQLALSRQNAELGADHQGDMHVVVVPASTINESEGYDYTNALKAYWQSPEYGKLGLAKNTIMVVIGVDDDFKTVVWSQARTGINFGNNGMLLALSNLGGQPFDPKTLFGNPTATITKNTEGKVKITYHHSSGVIEKIVMDDYAFRRPCMITCDDGQEGGFEYVSADIMLGTGDHVLLHVFNILAGVVLWAMFALVNFRREMFENAYRSIRDNVIEYRRNKKGNTS